jgi:transposase
MQANFSQAFKIQAVEKVLSRPKGVSIAKIADSLCVGYSTLERWIVQSRNQDFETRLYDGKSGVVSVTKEKRPQDWSLEDKLDMVIVCGPLSEEAVSQLCREQGLYPHHIKQWKQDFVSPSRVKNQERSPRETKTLKHEVKTLKKELNRKDKALAETAALLVLQKKVNEIWGNDEDSSQ